MTPCHKVDPKLAYLKSIHQKLSNQMRYTLSVLKLIVVKFFTTNMSMIEQYTTTILLKIHKPLACNPSKVKSLVTLPRGDVCGVT